MRFEFSPEKNSQLIADRNVAFEEVIALLERGDVIDILEHPNKERYGHQKIYLVKLNEYIYLVPFFQKDENTIFLKTIIPSRKLTKKWRTQNEKKH